MPKSDQSKSPALVEHYFRHEYGRLVSSLVRKFGVSELAEIEDSVQSALVLALTSWSSKGVPDKAGAWLYQVAHNRIIDQFRRQKVAKKNNVAEKLEGSEETKLGVSLEREIGDDELRMLFVCCDESLAPRTQLILALKILCGFSVKEIAFRLLRSEASIHKRIHRGRKQLAEGKLTLDTPSEEQLKIRLSSVLQVLYLLFNEGYSSCLSDRPIRQELCEEALRLTLILVEHPMGDHPESWALLALMHLHHARVESRTDGAGALLLLEEQDRSLWDLRQMEAGIYALSRSAQGKVFSRYHAEAGILVEHCLAPCYAETRWEKIVELYLILENIEPSPMYTLNRAIAVGEWKGAEVGLALLTKIDPPSWLLGYYLWDATLGELYRRSGQFSLAKKHLGQALSAAPTDSEKERLERRLKACGE